MNNKSFRGWRTRITAIILLLGCFTLALNQKGVTKGKWEGGLHYGEWSLSFLEDYLEDAVEDIMEDELKEAITDKHPGKTRLKGGYNQDLSLDSTGNNYGIETRFYPGGKEASFSLGLSVEKTEMKLDLRGLVRDEFTDGSYFDGSGSGKLLIKPISYHLSFRWDINPSGRLHPYITLGLGLASLEGYFYYEANGDFYDGSTEEHESENYSDEIDMETLEQIDPKITPIIIQLNVGLKYRMSDDFHFLIDGGFWDGFLLRGGVAFRF